MSDLFYHSMLHLESPGFFLFFPLIILAVFLGWFRKFPSILVSSLHPYQEAAPQTTWRSIIIRIPLIIEGLGMVFLMLALVRPQHGIEETIHRAEGIDIMLVLDVSGSMQAIDIPSHINTQSEILSGISRGTLQPRIDVAKEEIKRFLAKRINDRIGIIAFAGDTYTICPPTLDHKFLEGNLQRLEAGILSDGTGIAAPIAIATNRLKDSQAKRRVMVLLTDGENNIQDQISPLQAAKLAHSFDVIIHTVGIGSSRAIIGQEDRFGRQSFSQIQGSFDPSSLEEIATVSEGNYLEAKDAARFREVMEAINQLEKTSLEQPVYIDYKEFYRPLLFYGMILFGVAFLGEYTVFLRTP